MALDISTRYCGTGLASPLIIASSGLTEHVEHMARAQDAGAGAVVMKSLFEEEICRTAPTPRYHLIRHDMEDRETFTFLSYEQASEWGPKRYAEEVARAKKELAIKIIPSINCLKTETWKTWAKMMEDAGADILELNTSCPHASITFRGGQVEETIAGVVAAVRESVSLPVVAKISPMLTNPMGLVKMLVDAGADGVTVFNRMTALDIDLETEKPVMHGGYAGHGGPWAMLYPLRWISAIRPQVDISISGSGGVSSGKDVAKYILAGADAVQVCTAVYLNGFGAISRILEELKEWMRAKGYRRLDDFRSGITGKILGNDEVDRRHMLRALIANDLVAPCRGECPDGVPAQGYVRLAAQGRWEEAYALIKQHDPFQKTLGYICNHYCESACTRALVDSPVAIRAVKRAVIETAEKRGAEYAVEIAPSNGRKAAVVGAGPGGLTAAWELARAGYAVTVYEAGEEAGGMLRYGIPAFRLPREILDADIATVRSLGVVIKTSTPVEDVRSLKKEYDAVILAAGAWQSYALDVAGKDKRGVVDALDFLYKANRGEPMESLGRVAVIGGGNTAMDAARTALRLGADNVYVVYRRTREEMPALAEEVHSAEQEGVKILYLAVPASIEGTDKVEALRIAPAYLDEPDRSGRRRPAEAPEASPYDLAVDTVITALGQVVPQKQAGVSAAGGDALESSGVFPAGDCVHGAASVIEAVASGRRAAARLDAYVRGDGAILAEPRENRVVEKRKVLGRVRDWGIRTRVEPDLVREPKSMSKLVELTLLPETAIGEASRCLACGCGVGCDRCHTVCLYSAVESKDGRYSVDPEKCDGCGLCVQICPNANIEMILRQGT